jgi:hypothetical protein
MSEVQRSILARLDESQWHFRNMGGISQTLWGRVISHQEWRPDCARLCQIVPGCFIAGPNSLLLPANSEELVTLHCSEDVRAHLIRN